MGPTGDNMADLDNKSANQAPSLVSSDIVEDNVVHDFGYEPTYSRVFRSLGSMSLTMAMASWVSVHLTATDTNTDQHFPGPCVVSLSPAATSTLMGVIGVSSGKSCVLSCLLIV